MTLVFLLSQALLAARAAASYVSPFIGRLDDIGQDGIALVRNIINAFRLYGITTEIIAASIRSMDMLNEAPPLSPRVSVGARRGIINTLLSNKKSSW